MHFRYFLAVFELLSDSLTAIYIELHRCPSHHSILLTQGQIHEILVEIAQLLTEFYCYDGLQPKIRAGIINEHECMYLCICNVELSSVMFLQGVNVVLDSVRRRQRRRYDDGRLRGGRGGWVRRYPFMSQP